MTQVMQGFRILEVAEQTFVPAASAALADLGAEVIKIEHVERGDAMRGLASSGTSDVPDDVHPLMEHSNRHKKSLGLDLTSPEGRDILYRLAATSDVFLTNKLAGVRAKLQIDLDDIRAHNPQIVYVRGSGQGERGPDADKGSYDVLSFWARTGAAVGTWRPEYDLVPGPPGPGFGDSIGAITIAGAIMGGLLHRERTGEAPVVDVSLLGSGLWAMGQALALSLVVREPWTPPAATETRKNPLSNSYETADGRLLWFTCLQAGKYWPSLCRVVGHPEWADDPRFADHASLMEHSMEAAALLEQLFASAPLEEWRRRLEPFDGQWTVTQHTLEAAADPQTVANGYLQECRNAAGVPFQLVTVPMQYDEEPPPVGRAPEMNEHGDEILAGLGLDWDAILDLKVRGVVA